MLVKFFFYLLWEKFALPLNKQIRQHYFLSSLISKPNILGVVVLDE